MSELNGKVISHILQTKNITVKEAADDCVKFSSQFHS